MITVVPILSMNFSGSTLTGMLLNTHPDMLGVSELHSVLQWPGKPSRDNYLCGCRDPECPIFPQSELPMAPEGVYAKIARRSGSSVIVDGSKSIGLFDRMLRENEVREVPVVLVKSPAQILYSYYWRSLPTDRLRKDFGVKGRPRASGTTPERVSEIYELRYGERLSNRVDKCSDFVVAPYDRVVSNPQGLMDAICQAVGIETAPVDVESYADRDLRPFHMINGNTRAKNPSRPLALDDRWKGDSEWEPDDAILARMQPIYNRFLAHPKCIPE